MTSDEITLCIEQMEDGKSNARLDSAAYWLAEIALQLAESNDREAERFRIEHPQQSTGTNREVQK